MENKTYREFNTATGQIDYYAVVRTPDGQEYYKGAYRNRSKARRVAIKWTDHWSRRRQLTEYDVRND